MCTTRPVSLRLSLSLSLSLVCSNLHVRGVIQFNIMRLRVRQIAKVSQHLRVIDVICGHNHIDNRSSKQLCFLLPHQRAASEEIGFGLNHQLSLGGQLRVV